MFTEGLLFDLDGTLTDSDPLHFEAFVRTASDYGVAMDEEMFRVHVSGQTNANICRNLFSHVDDGLHPKIADDKEALFRSLIVGKLKPIPGLLDFLDWAKARGMGMAVVSNAPRANVKDMLAALGIADYFSAIVIGSELPRGKPDPLPYLTGLEKLGVPAAKTLAFEDAPPGITAAHRAGIATVALRTSLSDEEARANGANVTIADYRDPQLMAYVLSVLDGA
ncbi:HAD family hydrolase [Oryzibacter oryziterrae]|uniref:HAD family hydrolase n=1 Tax=Oryzibacter oryziterrae TaxID=2766474 RepID=UPI001F02D8BB|nr:HAD-IA family hydrolase [Oryzibacter oryziterrae]